MIELHDPDGYTVYLYRKVAQAPNPFGQVGIAPRKLGHVAMHAADAKASTDFFTTTSAFAGPTGWRTSSSSCAATPITTR